jgi:cysteinyl-tRNA synthetase
VGGKMFVVFAIEDNRGLETGFRYLIDDLVEYMHEGTEDSANKVKYRIASQFQKSIEAGKKWQSNKIEMMEAMRSEFTTPVATEAFKALIGRLEEASAEISTALFSKEYETIEDLSTITLVMGSIDTALSNYKYGHIKLPKSILEVMRGNIDKAVLDAIEEWDKNDSFDESMKKIETVMRLIRRMV